MREHVEWREPDLNRRHHGFQPCALPTELPRRAGASVPGQKRTSGPVIPRRERPCSRRLRPTFLLARSAVPGPPRSPQRAKTRGARARRATRVERHVDRRPRAQAVGDRDVAAGCGDAGELVEERDHVVERDEVERRRRRTGATPSRATSYRSRRRGRASLCLGDHAAARRRRRRPPQPASVRRSRRATRAGARAEIEHRAGRLDDGRERRAIGRSRSSFTASLPTSGASRSKLRVSGPRKQPPARAARARRPS